MILVETAGAFYALNHDRPGTKMLPAIGSQPISFLSLNIQLWAMCVERGAEPRKNLDIILRRFINSIQGRCLVLSH